MAVNPNPNPNPPSFPEPPTWPNQDNIPPELGGSPYNPSKPDSYPANAREFPKRTSPLLSWYSSGNLPPGCVISNGVVTSYHTSDSP